MDTSTETSSTDTLETDSVTSETMESESSEESVEDPTPTPSKRLKSDKKKGKNNPAKKLAKNARKKNDKKSKRSILEHIEEAQKIHSDVIGPEMDRELERVEKKLATWKSKDVEMHSLQRFVARILKKIKDLGIVASVDHAVFQKEMGRIHLLEMDIVDSANGSEDRTDREAARNKADELLHKAFDSGAPEKLQRTLQGTTWLYGQQNASSDSTSVQG